MSISAKSFPALLRAAGAFTLLLSLAGCAATNGASFLGHPVTDPAAGSKKSVATTTTTPTVPAQAAAAGFSTLLFDDEFNSLSLASSPYSSATDNWYPGIWWEGAYPSSSQITDSASVMTLSWTRAAWSANGNCDATISGENALATRGKSFRYGYFEVRMKWDDVTGAWPAIWMTPVQAIDGQQNTGEIDIFEGQGGDPTYYGTLHTWDGATQTWASNPNYFKVPAGTDFTQFHLYGVLWTPPANGKPGEITWYFDGNPIGSSPTTTSANSVFDTENYYLLLSAQEGVNWSNCSPLNDGSPSTINIYVDWVHAWGA
jgi:beta-glucanase (GH16 family)